MQSAGFILLLAAAVIVLFGGAGPRLGTAAPIVVPPVSPLPGTPPPDRP
ncbi:MAG: hypothetical protein NXH74_02775 [Rhodobacteraceae bacterium]|jgi:UDP-N-acetylglucosamine pyrophosphorylase|nr:hypothetical protein [Paracoccaceae bacterium]